MCDQSCYFVPLPPNPSRTALHLAATKVTRSGGTARHGPSEAAEWQQERQRLQQEYLNKQVGVVWWWWWWWWDAEAAEWCCKHVACVVLQSGRQVREELCVPEPAVPTPPPDPPTLGATRCRVWTAARSACCCTCGRARGWCARWTAPSRSGLPRRKCHIPWRCDACGVCEVTSCA